MIPTRRLVLLAVAPLVLGAVAFWLPGAIVPMLAIDAVLAVVGLADLAAAVGRVQATRAFAPVESVGRSFDVTLTLTNAGWRSLSLRVTDDAPGEAGGLPAVLALPRRASARVVYPLRIPERGEHAFGPVSVRWRSPLGLWERQARLDVPGSVRIYPEFTQLRHYGMRAREDERKAPVRVRRRPGGENEFERLRPYVQGDSFRHVDWKATARRRELITREFGQESNQNLIFLLDAGRMMSARAGDLTAFDHALNAALTMGQVALRHGDRVGLLAFDSRVRVWLPPKGGSRSGSRLIRGTYDVFPTLLEPDYALAFRHLAQHVRRRSLVVLLTAVVDEVNAAMTQTLVQGLRSRHLPLCVWIRDPEVDAMLAAPTTSPSGPYLRGAAAELLGWRDQALAGLQQRGALVVDAAPGDLTPSLLATYLEIKARRLL